MTVPARPCPDDAEPVRAAAVEAIEIAAVAFVEDHDEVTLAYVLRCAHRYLSVDEMRAATALDEPFVVRLLEEAA